MYLKKVNARLPSEEEARLIRKAELLVEETLRLMDREGVSREDRWGLKRRLVRQIERMEEELRRPDRDDGPQD